MALAIVFAPSPLVSFVILVRVHSLFIHIARSFLLNCHPFHVVLGRWSDDALELTFLSTFGCIFGLGPFIHVALLLLLCLSYEARASICVII